MVRALHTAGIEVILDVVYNHTAEGDGRGPTLSFRGIDNHAYYRLDDANPWRYIDYTGCGNSLNVRHPHSLQLIMDSLRYWILEMHVDGFRFDLASALARELHDVDRLSTFFDLVQQDPVVSQVKLIAEPWDVGEGGYQVGNFPPLWTEWNGKYRDTVRDFWRGQPATLPEFASRLTGSSDLYETTGRRPVASINFVTCHDGFTLADLVSYNGKHNEANGEDNRDGTDDNRSWNCGVEGPAEDPGDRRAARQAAAELPRHALPVPGHPDAAGRRRDRPHPGRQQQRLLPGQRDLLGGLVARGGRARPARVHPAAGPAAAAPPGVPPPPLLPRAPSPATGAGDGNADIAWLTPAGDEMTEADWRASYAKSVAVFLNGSAISEPDPRGDPVTDKKFLLLFNAGDGTDHVHHPRGLGAARHRLGDRHRHRQARAASRRTRSASCRRPRSRWPAARSWCSAPAADRRRAPVWRPG